MSALRARLSWLLCGWLLQCTAWTAPVALLAAGMSPNASAACDCPTDEGATCPMHQPSAHDGSAPEPCAFRAAHHPVDVALLTLAGGIGVLPAVASASEPPQSASFVASAPSAVVRRPARPFSPPPRPVRPIARS
jgi:hypothetical protein